jgi:intein-encoded DNA endonuclease-like protein
LEVPGIPPVPPWPYPANAGAGGGSKGGVQEVRGMAQGPGFCPEGEEVKKSDNITKTKRKEIPPLEVRIKAYDYAHELRKRRLTLREISQEIYRKYGVWISLPTISGWLRGVHSPYNDRLIPSLELLKPSEDLAYVIGVRLGDGYTYGEGYGYVIGLKAKDKEYVEKFATCLANVLGREPIRPRFRKDVGQYVAEAWSKTLYELLKKPVDLKRIRKHIEHCPKCVAAFLRGLFDAEACIGNNGHIKLYNTNYEVLVYAQRLLWRYFGIESTGPWPNTQKGTTMHDPKTGKQYKTNEDCYYIYIRAESLPKFYRYIGFTIRRKQKRLEEYLRRTGKL